MKMPDNTKVNLNISDNTNQLSFHANEQTFLVHLDI